MKKKKFFTWEKTSLLLQSYNFFLAALDIALPAAIPLILTTVAVDHLLEVMIIMIDDPETTMIDMMIDMKIATMIVMKTAMVTAMTIDMMTAMKTDTMITKDVGEDKTYSVFL